MMRISPRGIRAIQDLEALRLTGYRDHGRGVVTIGWGHTGIDVAEGMVITKATADELLANDLKLAERCINIAVTSELQQCQFDALVSFVYNIGCPSFRHGGPNGGPCQVLARLNLGDFLGAANHMLDWKFSGRPLKLDPILVRRRHGERGLFISGMAISSS